MIRKFLCLVTIMLAGARCQPLNSDLEGLPTRDIESSAFEPSAAIVPLPDYLGAVFPGPGEHYTLTEYENLAPSLHWEAQVPCVCLSVSPIPFLEPGDLLTAQQWLSRVHLVIDDERVTRHSVLETDSDTGYHYNPETGDLVFSASWFSISSLLCSVAGNWSTHSYAYG
jgi:hypothetical protein